MWKIAEKLVFFSDAYKLLLIKSIHCVCKCLNFRGYCETGVYQFAGNLCVGFDVPQSFKRTTAAGTVVGTAVVTVVGTFQLHCYKANVFHIFHNIVYIIPLQFVLNTSANSLSHISFFNGTASESMLELLELHNLLQSKVAILKSWFFRALISNSNSVISRILWKKGRHLAKRKL